MHILIVDKEFPPNPHGGIGSYNFSLANLLHKIGYEVTVLSCNLGPNLISSKESYGWLYRIPYLPISGLVGKYISFINPFLFSRRLIPTIRQMIQKKKFDFMEFPSTEGYGYLSARYIKDIPVVTRFHGSMGKAPIDDNAITAYRQELTRYQRGQLQSNIALQLRKPLWGMESDLLLNSDQITFPSQFSQVWIGKKLGKVFKEYPVIPNGIDVQYFSKNYYLPNLNQPLAKKTIFYVGRCSLPKGAGVFVRALPGILRRDTSVEVVFAGPLPDSAIQSQLVQLQALFPNRVQFQGRISREILLKQLSSCYMLVHPTFYEISPMAVIEAMALGIPSVVSDTGPLQELITNGETGYLFQVGDSDSLEAAVLNMLSLNVVEYEIMREACVQRARATFDLNTIVHNLDSVYSSLVK